MRLHPVLGASVALAASVLTFAQDNSHDWVIAGPFGGTATTVAVDPQNPKTVFAGGMNSLLYVSSDAGATWSMLNFPKHTMGEVTSILVDPANSAHILVGTLDAWGGGLYESVDAGKTWALNANFRNVGVRALAAAPSKPSEFVAGTLDGVQMSTDSGKTWNRISDPGNHEMLGITAIAVDAKEPNIIYAGTPHLPWRTLDGGKTWESIHTGMIDDSDVFSIYVDPKAPATIFASACSGIYQSLARGDMWHKIAGIPNTSRRTHVIREDPNHDGTIFAGTTMGLFRSPNNGATWKILTPTQVNALAFDPAQANTLYAAMQYEGVGKSQDDGDTISKVNTGFVDRQIASITRSGSNLIAIETMEDTTTGFFASSDAGATWTQLPTSKSLAGTHLQYVVGSATNGRILLAATTQRIYKTENSGALWAPAVFRVASVEELHIPVRVKKGSKSPKTLTRTRTTIRTIQPGDIFGLCTVQWNGKPAIAALTGAGVFFSSDLGDQWTRIEVPSSSPVTRLWDSGSGRMVARSAEGLFVSDPNSAWQRMEFPLPVSDINDIALSSAEGDPILVATRVGIYSSPDGKKWSVATTPAGVSTFSSITYTGTSAYASQFGDLYQSSDKGGNWTKIQTHYSSLPLKQLWKTEAAPNRLYALTSGLGILFRD